MRVLASFLVLLLTATAPALAQQEPPARVGRVAYAAGNLSFRVAGDGQWSQAGVNYPVATGGSFWTDAQGRAEIAVGPTTIALAGGTELDVVNLSEQTTQLGLPQGRVFLRLRQLAQGQSVEVDLPQGGVWLLQPGAYDIDAGAADRPGRVQVFEGSARFAGGGADLEIDAGNAAVLTGSDPVAAQLGRAEPDEFVEWCQARDAERSRVAAPRYVSPQMTGYAELDPYGDWRSSPQYGAVWYPSQVPTGWAPYRDGHWISVPPWGWTWVDDQPWGFAPSHYGRWAYVGDRWGWVPGQLAPQPVYAPALVAFVGAGIAAAAVGPSIGWFPLAPGEVYWPSYTRNAYYIRNVNINNVNNINTVIVNNQGAPPAQVAGAAFANRQFATVVPQRVFAGAGNVAPAMVRVPQATLRQAPVSVQPPRVTPVALPAKAAGPPIVPRHPTPASVGPTLPAPSAPGQPPRAPEGTAQHAPAVPGLSLPPSPAAALPPRTPGSPERPREVSRGTTTEPVKSPAGAPAAINPSSPSPEAARRPVAPEPQRPAASREPRPSEAAHAPPPVVAPRQPPAQTQAFRPPETVRPASPPAQTQVFRTPQTFRPVQPPAARAPVAAAPAHPPAPPAPRAVPAARPPVQPAARPAAPQSAPTAARAAPQAQPHPQATQKPPPRGSQAAHETKKKGENDRPN